MPEIIPNHVPSPRTLLAWDGTAYRPITIDAAGHVQVDVLTSGLPAGAATAANQALILAQVQAIEDLTHALQSINTDRLQVRGMDQLFSYKNSLISQTTGPISGAGGFYASDTPPAGQVWKVTNVYAVDWTTATTVHGYLLFRGAANYNFEELVAAFPAATPSTYHGEIWLHPGDVIRVWFTGSLAGDSCTLGLTGYAMTLEV